MVFAGDIDESLIHFRHVEIPENIFCTDNNILCSFNTYETAIAPFTSFAPFHFDYF
jgi:hypothetical protein